MIDKERQPGAGQGREAGSSPAAGGEGSSRGGGPAGGANPGRVSPRVEEHPHPPRPSRGRSLRRYFFTGLIVILPVAISVFILWRLFFALDRVLGPFIEQYLGRSIPGVGLVALVALIIMVGAIASNFIGRRLIRAGERLVNRIPLVRWIYRTTKQLFSTLFHERSTSFRKVVLIDFPYKGIYALAFQTSDSGGIMEEAVGKRLVTVYLPTTPNPTSGYLLLVPEDDVVPLAMSVDDGLRLVISAGALMGDNDD
jgi:uncharacterized membrane protein